MKVPIRWSAIEVLEERTFSVKSDIWAFGILSWEVFAYGAMPYPSHRNHEVVRLLQSARTVANCMPMAWPAGGQAHPADQRYRPQTCVQRTDE